MDYEKKVKFGIASYLIIIIVCLGSVLIILWPNQLEPNNSSSNELVTGEKSTGNQSDTTKTEQTDSLTQSNKKEGSTSERSFLIICIIAGVLGACLHAIVSLGVFSGNHDFDPSWFTWYIFRPFVGGILAMLFYFVFRGDFIVEVNSTTSFHGLVALSGMIGLFSKQALDKLSEIFDIVFLNTKAEKLRGKLVEKNPVPGIKKIAPDPVEFENDEPAFKIKGNDFVKESVVRVNGKDMPTKFEKSDELTVQLADLDLTDGGEIRIRVFNPPPGGGISDITAVKTIKK